MGRHSQTLGHLERSHEDNALRRAIAARLDRTMQKAGVSSAKAANWLDVSEDDVQFWRRGITVPPLPPIPGPVAGNRRPLSSEDFEEELDIPEFLKG